MDANLIDRMARAIVNELSPQRGPGPSVDVWEHLTDLDRKPYRRAAEAAYRAMRDQP